MSVLNTTFEGSSDVSYNSTLLTFVPLRANTLAYRLQHVYKVHNFYIKTIGYSCLSGENHKFIANVADKDHKITKMHHFVVV